MFTRLFHHDTAALLPGLHPDQQLNRALLDSVTDYGLGLLDAAGRVLIWNEAAHHLTGFDPEYASGKQLFDIFPDENSNSLWTAFEETRETGRFTSEVEYLDRNGANRHIELVLTPVRVGQSDPSGYVVLLREPVLQDDTITNVNTRKISFELLINSVEDYAIFMLDPDGRVVSWNVGAERLKGYRADEIVGRHISVFYTAEEVQQGKPQRNLKIARETGRFEGEGWRRHKDGSPFWASVIITALRDKSGNVRGFAKVTRDLTHHYRATIAALPNGVLLLGPDGTTFACNANACRLLDMPEAVLLGKRPTDLDIDVVHEDGTPVSRSELPMHITLTTGTPCHGVALGIRSRRGKLHWVSVDTNLFGMEKNGHASGIVVSLHDISQLKDSHDIIRRGEQLFRSLVAASAQIVWEAGPDGAFRNISGAFESLTGTPPDEARDWGWMRALPAADRVRVKKAWHDARVRGSPFEVEFRMRMKDGTTRFFLMRGVPLKSETGQVREWVGTLSDIDARKQHEHELERKANYDELTGLANRSVLTDRLDQAIAHASRAGRMVAVLFIDLDNFKDVNDGLGHQLGDALLRSVAQRLSESIRSGDTVARVGGDEFVIVLTQLHDADDVRKFHAKLRRALSKPIALGDRLLQVTGSIGAAVSPADGMTVTDLLRRADLAMYRVKQQGRNGMVFYQAGMDAPQNSNNASSSGT